MFDANPGMQRGQNAWPCKLVAEPGWQEAHAVLFDWEAKDPGLQGVHKAAPAALMVPGLQGGQEEAPES